MSRSQGLLNELEQLKSMLDAVEPSASHGAQLLDSKDIGNDGVPLLREPLPIDGEEEIPLLDAVVDNVDDVEVPSYSRNPFLPDSLKRKLAGNNGAATLLEQIAEGDMLQEVSQWTPTNGDTDTQQDPSSETLKSSDTPTPAAAEDVAPQPADQPDPQLEAMVDQLVADYLPIIARQLKEKLLEQVGEQTLTTKLPAED